MNNASMNCFPHHLTSMKHISIIRSPWSISLPSDLHETHTSTIWPPWSTPPPFDLYEAHLHHLTSINHVSTIWYPWSSASLSGLIIKNASIEYQWIRAYSICYMKNASTIWVLWSLPPPYHHLVSMKPHLYYLTSMKHASIFWWSILFWLCSGSSQSLPEAFES